MLQRLVELSYVFIFIPLSLAIETVLFAFNEMTKELEKYYFSFYIYLILGIPEFIIILTLIEFFKLSPHLLEVSIFVFLTISVLIMIVMFRSRRGIILEQIKNFNNHFQNNFAINIDEKVKVASFKWNHIVNGSSFEKFHTNVLHNLNNRLFYIIAVLAPFILIEILIFLFFKPVAFSPFRLSLEAFFIIFTLIFKSFFLQYTNRLLTAKTFSGEIHIYEDGLYLHPIFQPYVILAPMDIYLNQRAILIPVSEIESLVLSRYFVRLILQYKNQIIRIGPKKEAFWVTFTLEMLEFNSFKKHLQKLAENHHIPIKKARI